MAPKLPEPPPVVLGYDVHIYYNPLDPPPSGQLATTARELIAQIVDEGSFTTFVNVLGVTELNGDRGEILGCEQPIGTRPDVYIRITGPAYKPEELTRRLESAMKAVLAPIGRYTYLVRVNDVSLLTPRTLRRQQERTRAYHGRLSSPL